MDEARYFIIFYPSFTWDQYISLGTFSLRSMAWEQVIEGAWLPWTGRICSPTLLITTTSFPHRLAGWSRRLEIPLSAFAMILTVQRLCPQCLCRVLRRLDFFNWFSLIQCALVWGLCWPSRAAKVRSLACEPWYRQCKKHLHVRRALQREQSLWCIMCLYRRKLSLGCYAI